MAPEIAPLNRVDLDRMDGERKAAGVPFVGTPTLEPCDVCGGVDHNQQEPRFLYTVCAGHADMAPFEVQGAKELRRLEVERKGRGW